VRSPGRQGRLLRGDRPGWGKPEASLSRKAPIKNPAPIESHSVFLPSPCRWDCCSFIPARTFSLKETAQRFPGLIPRVREGTS